MKKVLVTFTLGIISIFVIVFVFVFYNKLYYPPLPIENMSKKEVVEKINDSNTQMIKLTNENNKGWYLIKERNGSIADTLIVEMMSQNDWVFKEKDGAGLFFEKNGEILIIVKKQWTGDFKLVEIPINFDK